MSDFAMHYRTKNEQNNEKPVLEKAKNESCASEEDDGKFSRKKCSKQNVVYLLNNHGECLNENVSNQNKNYVTIGYDCLLVDDDADIEEVFKNSQKSEKKSKKLKIKRNKSQTVHESNHQEISSTKTTSSADEPPSSAGVVAKSPSSSSGKRSYKESTSIDSGIECESSNLHHLHGGNFIESIDTNFGEFLLDSEDNFLDSALDYISPKFSCNRFDNILAFTLHAKNVVVHTIECQKLADIGAARIKFYSNTSQQHYAFFVKITPPLHNSSVLSQHFNENNNTAMVMDVSAETWDNNVVFQIELDPIIARDVEEYYCGVSKYELEPKQLTAKVLQGVPEPSHVENSTVGQEDEGLSIEVENSSESEISIAIKGKENENRTSGVSATAAATKRRIKKKKNRSMSESCCDELKVISESETLTTEECVAAAEKKEIVVPRKTRSISESAYHSVEEPDHIHHTKYKSILKHSSFDSSADELFYSTSFDIQMGGGSTDPEMSESCKKSVRFSEHITRQLYRSTSSILAQKKKNQRKNEAKRRLLERKNSECESADEEKEINDIPEDEPPEETRPTTEKMTKSNNKKNKKRGLEKPNMIFDLEI